MSFIEDWEKVKATPPKEGRLTGVVRIDLDEWAGRVALRSYAYALIATGNEALGKEILKKIGGE